MSGDVTEGLVHSRQERELAVSMWLLLAAADTQHARTEWENHGVALLRCGVLFSAVRIPAAIVHEAASTTDPAHVALCLTHALDGGPIFHDGRGRAFYALPPPSTAKTWRIEGTECLGSDTFLGVPAVDINDRNATCATYWCVPMDGPAALCASIGVARLAMRGRDLLAMVGALDG